MGKSDDSLPLMSHRYILVDNIIFHKVKLCAQTVKILNLSYTIKLYTFYGAWKCHFFN